MITGMENLRFAELILPMVIAVTLVAVPFTWKYLISPYVTVIHEYGHAVANIITFGRPHSIKARFADGGGVTHSLRYGGFLSGIGAIFSGLSGYPAPIIFGVALISSVTGGYQSYLLTFSAIAFALFILLMRNLAGFMIAIFTAGYFFVAAQSHPWAEGMVYFAGSVFLVAGIMDMIRLISYYFRGLSEETDLGILKEGYFLPQFFWLILMIIEIVFFSWLILGTA